MFKPFSFLLVLVTVFSSSGLGFADDVCQNSGSPKNNIKVVKKFYKAFNTKEKNLLDQALAEDWVDVPVAPGQGPGRQGMKDAMDGYYASFPNFTVVNEDFITNGNKVVVRSTIHATQKGEFSSVKASDKPIEVMAIDIHELCGDHIKKTWHVEDWLTGLFQMGALPLK